MCMKQPSSPSVEPPLVCRNKRSVAIGDCSSSGSPDDTEATASSHTTENESVEKMLKTICDHIDTRVDKEEEQRCEDDKKNEMKNDWMLAAAVLDRICVVAFAIVVFGGNSIFIILFAMFR